MCVGIVSFWHYSYHRCPIAISSGKTAHCQSNQMFGLANEENRSRFVDLALLMNPHRRHCMCHVLSCDTQHSPSDAFAEHAHTNPSFRIECGTTLRFWLVFCFFCALRNAFPTSVDTEKNNMMLLHIFCLCVLFVIRWNGEWKIVQSLGLLLTSAKDCYRRWHLRAFVYIRWNNISSALLYTCDSSHESSQFLSRYWLRNQKYNIKCVCVCVCKITLIHISFFLVVKSAWS